MLCSLDLSLAGYRLVISLDGGGSFRSILQYCCSDAATQSSDLR